ncbi:hypothetical protein OAY27_02030 [Candidatus Pelagibacter sp.]|nr:hypothetical protein [Candidatus Pelagibacter sp.]
MSNSIISMMKKLLGILFLGLLLSENAFSETCEKDLSYELSWLKPNYDMLYLDIFNSNKNHIIIPKIKLVTKDNQLIKEFKPTDVRDKNWQDNQIFSVRPFGKNFTSFGSTKINHKVVHKVLFACASFVE